MIRCLLPLCLLMACQGQRQGTFIGNPNLTTRYVDGVDQQALGGELVSEELIVRGCAGDDVNLGRSAFDFDGALSVDAEQIPEGDYCGVFIAIQQLRLEFVEGSDDYRITGHDIALEIEGSFEATDDSTHVIQLADANWLGELTAIALPGDSDANSENPQLQAAFIAGLDRTTIEAD